jgi:Transposase
MQVLYERCAAVDVGKDVIAVAVRLPGDGPDGRATRKRTFKTFYGVLREAARWLSSQGVTQVAMEATGIYSMPVYHALIELGEFAQVLVCNAGHVKNVPGRKTDLADAVSCPVPAAPADARAAVQDGRSGRLAFAARRMPCWPCQPWSPAKGSTPGPARPIIPADLLPGAT